MDYHFVEERDGTYYVRGSRIPLQGIVLVWRDGHSAEEIRDNFPSLSLAQVYGAIAFYLDHQQELDQHLKQLDAKYEAQRAAAEATEPERYAAIRQRLNAARARLESSAS